MRDLIFRGVPYLGCRFEVCRRVARLIGNLVDCRLSEEDERARYYPLYVDCPANLPSWSETISVFVTPKTPQAMRALLIECQDLSMIEP